MWLCGKIKKTCTVMDRGLLLMRNKILDMQHGLHKLLKIKDQNKSNIPHVQCCVEQQNGRKDQKQQSTIMFYVPSGISHHSKHFFRKGPCMAQKEKTTIQ